MSQRKRRIQLEDDTVQEEEEATHTKKKKKNDDSNNNSISINKAVVVASPLPTTTFKDDEHGHRYGNFGNYYKFNPPSNRISIMGDVLDYIAQKLSMDDDESSSSSSSSNNNNNTGSGVFTYCDIGCNQGDLTMEVARALMHRSADTQKIAVVGVDLDPQLIQRATQTYGCGQNDATTTTPQTTKDDDDDDSSRIVATHFVTANVLEDDNLLPLLLMDNNNNNNNQNHCVNLLSLFSTTMWLHIHAGDEGFKRLLGKLCQQTKNFLLLEPQSSKRYVR
jgi:hypothetical protein